MTSRIPAILVIGGEGQVGENKEETEPHPLVLVARREMVGGGRSTADRVAAGEELVGRSALVVDGRREAVGKMREGEADLLEGLG